MTQITTQITTETTAAQPDIGSIDIAALSPDAAAQALGCHDAAHLMSTFGQWPPSAQDAAINAMMRRMEERDRETGYSLMRLDTCKLLRFMTNTRMNLMYRRQL
jgi:hypothetical protein